MKSTTITNDYYKVKWEAGKTGKIIMYVLLIVFNIAEVFIAMEAKDTFAAFICLVFFDVILGALVYIGYKIPCVKWDVNWKRPEEPVDITEKQEKYRTIMNVVIVCVMIWGIVQTITTGNSVIVD